MSAVYKQTTAVAADSLSPNTRSDDSGKTSVGSRIANVGGWSEVRCLTVLVSVWLSSLLLLLILQVSGLHMGLKVWPMGEDRVWIDLLQNHSGSGIARAFWLINDRNPLSPWWYFLVSPLVVHFDYGIYLVRKVVDIILASSVFLLLSQLLGARLRPFALITSVAVLAWNFSFCYTEQIMWPFLLALSIGNFSLTAFLKYLDGGRKNGQLLGASLVLYFIALGSYTIQCGTPLAVFLLSLLRGEQPLTHSPDDMHALPQGSDALQKSKAHRLRAALGDAIPFGVMFAFYLLTWITTTRISSEYYDLSPALISSQIGISVRNLFWHDDFTNMWLTVVRDWNPLVLASVCGLTAAGSYLAIRRWIATPFLVAARDLPRLSWLWLAVVVVSVSLPTLLLESMSTTWYPGTRIRMIQQMVTPCVFVGAMSFIAALTSGKQKNLTLATNFLSLVLSVLFAFTLCCGLEYNKLMTRQTEFEKRFAQSLDSLVTSAFEHQYFVVRLDNVSWNCSPFLQDQWIRTALNNKHVSLRILPSKSAPEGWERVWRVVLGDRKQGIQHPAFETENRFIPWDMVPVLSFDGKNLRVIDPITAKEFSGLQVDCLFNKPVKQVVVPRIEKKSQ